jgi:hypothetical protein
MMVYVIARGATAHFPRRWGLPMPLRTCLDSKYRILLKD